MPFPATVKLRGGSLAALSATIFTLECVVTRSPAAESPFINVVTAVEWPRKLNPTSAAAALSSAGSAAGGQFDRIAKCPVVAAIHWANCHNLSPGSYPGSWVSPPQLPKFEPMFLFPSSSERNHRSKADI